MAWFNNSCVETADALGCTGVLVAIGLLLFISQAIVVPSMVVLAVMIAVVRRSVS